MARKQRHPAYVAEHTEDIRHIAGVDNVVADALSSPASPPQVAPDGNLQPERCQSLATDEARLLVSIVLPFKAVPVPWAELAAVQHLCAKATWCRGSSMLQIYKVNMQESKCLCDTATGMLRPLVPVPTGFHR